MAAFQEAAKQYGLEDKPDLNAAFRIPGVLSDTGGLDLPATFEQPFLQLFEQALETLNEFRAREGAELAR